MSTKLLICPDCGGIIGATSVTDSGKPCTCFSTSSGDTSMLENVAPKPKICCKCGADVQGKKRLKDSLGYWCYDCHKADEAAKRPVGVRCADCNRTLLETALTEYAGLKLCEACLTDRKQINKKKEKYKLVSHTAHNQYERKRLFMMLGFVAILVALVVLRKLNIIGELPF
jgi:ribosomal protein L34E